MATTAQILANRLNSRKSTGPKTQEGKAAVSQNAVKHGLFAESVITGEDPDDYEAFHDKMLAELAPVGMVETMLAERTISLWWRLKRAERIQNQAIDVMIARDEPSPLSKRLHNCLPKDLQEIDYDTRGAGPELVLGRAIIKDLSNTRVLERLMLYERRIESSLTRIMKELKRCQIMRQIEQQDEAIHKTNGFEAATRTTMEKKVDLKKQSQFNPTLIDVTSYLKGDYDNNMIDGTEENKAKQSQFHANMPTDEAEKSDKPVASATG